VHPKVKITTICENRTPGFGLLPEYGLSMLLEMGDKKILFDTGSGSSLIANAQLLGKDLRTLNAVVFSHGHVDHTGGLDKLLEKNNSLPVYAHPDIFNKYLGTPEAPSYVGPPWTREFLQEQGVKFCPVQGPLKLEEGLIITGQIPRVVEFEKQEPQFLQKTERGFEPDEIYDDQALVVESPEGTIVLLGCTHAGLINTLSYVAELTGKDNIHAFIGGTHLMNASESRIARTLEALGEFGLNIIAPCHCTGFQATVALHQAFNKEFMSNLVGSVFEFA